MGFRSVFQRGNKVIEINNFKGSKEKSKYKLKDKGPSPEKKKSIVIPSERVIKARYYQEIERDGGSSYTTNTWLGWLGYVYTGRRSMVEGKKALGIRPHEPFPLTIIEQKIRKFWPKPELERIVKSGQRTERTVCKFKAAHPVEYMAAHNHYGGMKGVLENMDPPYSSAYSVLVSRNHRSDRITQENQECLSGTLLDWYCSGRFIAPSYLATTPIGSEERKASNDLVLIARSGSLHARSRSEVIKQLTGLSLEDFRISKGSSKQYSRLTERLAQFVLTWADTLGLNVPWIPQGRLKTEESERLFHHNGQDVYADFRIRDHSIEVKSPIGALHPVGMRKIIGRYTPGNNNWADGWPISDSTLILLQPRRLYSRYESDLAEAGINLVTYETFYQTLEQVLAGIKKDKSLIQDLVPRVNLDAIESLGKELLHPSLLLRPRNRERRTWLCEMLDSLNQRARKLKTKKRIDETRVPRLDIPESRTGSNSKGKYITYQRKFNELPKNPIKKAIAKNRQQLTADNLKQRFPILSQFELTDQGLRVVSFDLETCGRAYSDPILSIGYCIFTGKKLDSRVLLARDYSQEAAIISEFLKELTPDSIVLTYNGNFDLPRLTQRAIANGVKLNGERFRSLKEVLGDRHIDLMDAAKNQAKYDPKLRLPDYKLITLEEHLWGYTRMGDIPSREIPSTYHCYLRGYTLKREPVMDEHGEPKTDSKTGEPETKFVRVEGDINKSTRRVRNIVYHNLQDVVSYQALLLELLKPVQ
ncbi:MAG: ribonuclease H-like domain-containing protein [Candidatus Nanoarchaeia archaeon]|nr:ribonuclease H-like domain-containing protein [Candidatus Nanoarchaeia archaeon]